MSGVLTPDFASQLFIAYFWRSLPPFTHVEVALTRKIPVNNASTNQLDEPQTGNYSRSVPFPMDQYHWDFNAAGEIFNSQGISWPAPANAEWGTINGWALIASGLGSILAVGDLTVPARFVAGMHAYLPPGSLSMGLFD